MVRLSGLIILMGAVWLASTAIPQADAQRRMDRIIGISLGSNPYATSVNSISRSSSTETQSNVARTSRTLETGRSPIELFGPVADQVVSNNAARPSTSKPQAIKVRHSKHAPAPKQKALVKKSPEKSAPKDPVLSATERAVLVRHIQRELRRVGCYSGTVDGVWGPESRRGMTAFGTKISTPVSLDEPDYVGLMLIETYSARACDAKPVPKPIIASLPIRPSGVLKAARTTRVTSSPALPLPTASPSRLINQIAQRVPAKAKQKTARARSTSKRAKPRVASAEIRLSKQRTEKLAEQQRVEIRTLKSKTRSSAAKEKRLAQAKRIKKDRARNAERRRIAAQARNRRRARARQRTQRRRVAALRAKRVAQRRARKRQTRRRYRNAPPAYGFKSRRRAWVRRAFTHKR